MIKYKFLFICLLLLISCKPQTEGFDNTSYDLYKESQFANGFALIKDDYGKRLDPRHDERNYIDGIMAASVMFGEMDLLSIKKQVIARMDSPDIESDEEGIWRPLYDGVRHSHGHKYEALYGWIYWLIFNPQVDKAKIGLNDDALTDIAILTAISRADVSFWHNKLFTCMNDKLPAERVIYDESWIKATDECQKEYANKTEKIATEICTQLKALPQYQKNK